MVRWRPFKKMAKPQEPEDWETVWNERLAALESILGESSDIVWDARPSFDQGGNADVLVFEKFVAGIAYVTADLTGSRSPQPPSRLGQYELMICTKSEAIWAIKLISRLLTFTLDEVLNPNDTLGNAMPEGSNLKSMICTTMDGTHLFSVSGQECGLLLLIGITDEEMALKTEKGSKALISRLKSSGVYPFTDPGRQSVV